MEVKSTLAGRSIFVTGHTGFKGSWLALWLHRLGSRVTGYALPPPTFPNNFEASGIENILGGHHLADIRDTAKLTAAMQRAQPNVVLHLAALPIVRESYLQPRETFDVNVMGTASVLEAVRNMKRPCVVIVVTSDKCYENREQIWGYREHDPMGGSDPYSASKGACEILVSSYRRSFFNPNRVKEHGVKLATARAGNVIGGGDWAKDRIVVDAVQSLSRQEPIRVRNPRAVRPWQHVLEPLSGYLTLAARMLSSDDPHLCDGWNFGPKPGDQLPVSNLVDMFCRAWGDGEWLDCSDPSQPHEAGLLSLNIEKAILQLNWRPRWTSEETVERTARWYKTFFNAPKSAAAGHMRQACLDDIEAYEN